MVVLAALVYPTALFAIAHVGENRGRRLMTGRARPLIDAPTPAPYSIDPSKAAIFSVAKFEKVSDTA
jgi:hypothetical protein